MIAAAGQEGTPLRSGVTGRVTPGEEELGCYLGVCVLCCQQHGALLTLNHGTQVRRYNNTGRWIGKYINLCRALHRSVSVAVSSPSHNRDWLFTTIKTRKRQLYKRWSIISDSRFLACIYLSVAVHGTRSAAGHSQELYPILVGAVWASGWAEVTNHSKTTIWQGETEKWQGKKQRLSLFERNSQAISGKKWRQKLSVSPWCSVLSYAWCNFQCIHSLNE